MTPEEFAQKMRECGDDDPEGSHLHADRLMLTLLRELGYGEGCDIFEEMDKWYA